MRRLSVVITNYNYGSFVESAVRSAFALRWDDTEVIVVDDGSTDGSLQILQSFGDRIRLHRQENRGQREAANAGFALSTGEVVVFLDSDDVLPPDLPQHLHRAFVPGVSKVQLQAQRIDARGELIGRPFPGFRLTPTAATIRRWTLSTTAYPTPPGSANAYARWFLERLMPVTDIADDAADSALLAAAPLLGDVVTIPGVLIGYRRHGGNDSRMLADRARFAREVRRARARWRFARHAAGLPPADQVLRRSRELLQLRAAAYRADPGDPGLHGDGRGRLLLDALRSPFAVGPDLPLHRMAIALWAACVVLAPSALAGALVELRYREPPGPPSPSSEGPGTGSAQDRLH